MSRILSITFIILFCAIVSTQDYIRNHGDFCNDCTQVVIKPADDILTGSAGNPFIYRILTPNIIKLMGGDIIAVALFHLSMRFIFLSLLYIWVDRWKGNAIAAVSLMTVLLSVMSYTWYDSDYALTEAVIITAGLIILTSSRLTTRHYLSFAILIILGFLNREMTGLILIMSWLVLHYQKLRLSIFYILVSIVTFFCIRISIGNVENFYTVAYVFDLNMTAWRLRGAITYNVILAPLWMGILFNYKRLPEQYTRLLLVLIPYMGLFLTFAIWQEIRLLLPVAILLLPLIRQSPIKKNELI